MTFGRRERAVTVPLQYPPPSPVHFEIAHEFDIPLDALELAVLSPDLAKRIDAAPERHRAVEQREHALKDGVLERVWRYQANMQAPAVRRALRHARDVRVGRASDLRDAPPARVDDHAPREARVAQVLRRLRGRTSSSPSAKRGTRRIVRGELELRVSPVFRRSPSGSSSAEVKKTFDAEAATLRDIATLG